MTSTPEDAAETLARPTEELSVGAFESRRRHGGLDDRPRAEKGVVLERFEGRIASQMPHNGGLITAV